VESDDPRRKLLNFPFYVGKKWKDITYNYPFGDMMKKTRKATYDEDFKLEGVEEVVTATGTFKAYKIYFEHTNRKAGQSG